MPPCNCSARPSCGCYLGADDPLDARVGSGFLQDEYAAVCPASDYAALDARDVACSAMEADGALGSPGLVAVLIGGLSLGALWSLQTARCSPMRPVQKSEQLSFFHSVKTTVKNDSFCCLAACFFCDGAQSSVEGTFATFFLTYAIGLDSAVVNLHCTRTHLMW